MEVKIIFADGTEIDAVQNGDSYIVDERIEVTEEQLETVTIQSEDEEKVFNNAELVECASVDEKFWFAFREITPEEEEANQLRADVDYLLAISE